MKKELIQNLTVTFEAHAQQTEAGVEYWLARDLQYLLGYSKWDNFLNVVSKARTACELSGHEVANHFAGVGKMVGDGWKSATPAARGTAKSHQLKLGHRARDRAIDGIANKRYRAPYIRPMAVRPLDHPERWPTPWGFLFRALVSPWGSRNDCP